MVKINYNYDKKEFTQLFRKWYKRTLKGNCIRIYFLLLFLILGYITYKAGNELLYTSQGKIQKSIFDSNEHSLFNCISTVFIISIL